MKQQGARGITLAASAGDGGWHVLPCTNRGLSTVILAKASRVEPEGTSRAGRPSCSARLEPSYPGHRGMSWNEPPKTYVAVRARTSAKALRRGQTEAEKRLWWHLRHRLPVEGSHFRRQVPIGPYVADFCCLSVRLILEVDGEHHAFKAGADYDRRRDAYLQNEGFRVLRFSNRMVQREIDVVLDTIHAALAAAFHAPFPDQSGQAEPPPPPGPSPQGGGELAER